MKDSKEIRDTKQGKEKRARGGDVKKVAPEGYYTARQAQQKLGMNPSTFSYYVRNGKINRHVPPLRSEGFYDRKEIDRLATEIALFLHTHEETTKIETRIARPEDTPGIEAVLTSMGWQAATAEQRRQWYAVNPEIDYIVLRNSAVAGYIHAVPFKPEALQRIMSGQIHSWDITPGDIAPFVPGTRSKPNKYNLYIGIATRRDVPNNVRLSFRLISGYIDFLDELAARHIIIRRLYGVSAEDDGQRIARGLGFVRAPEEPGDKFPRFELDLETSGSHFARKYREIVAKHTA